MTPAFVQGLRAAKRRHHPRGGFARKKHSCPNSIAERCFVCASGISALWIPIRGFLIISKTPNTHPLQ
jgi:hypothetical protein